ncbi:MAG: ATP-dependent Clp protease proteolytic subunit [Rhodospirillales bacterium]
MASFILAEMLPKDMDFFVLWPLLLAIFVFSITASVWCWVGIWRSARHAERIPAAPGGARSGRLWAYAAQVVVTLSVAYTVLVIALVAIDANSFISAMKPAMEARYDLRKAGDDGLEFSGFLNPTSVNKVIDALDAEPQRRIIFITSEGGLLDNAFDLADVVQKRQIQVVAQTNCASACLLVLAAAHERYAQPGTQLLFHRPAPLAEIMSPGADKALAMQEREYFRRFRDYGVPEASLRLLSSREFTPLTLAQARAHNLIDGVWQP